MSTRSSNAVFPTPRTASIDVNVIHDRAALDELRAGSQSLAFVPTMGGLHEGHTALVRLGREHAAQAVASIYVNPLQFGPDEDFARYPRSLEADLELLERAGATAVFVPDDALLSVSHQRVYVAPSPLAEDLCGRFRPGHFRGVATIVLKLLNLVRPDKLVMGKKDLQQLTIIREMLADFCLDIDLVAAPIVREADGLAMSSRNRYLSAAERQRAAQLNQALMRIAQSRAPEREIEHAREELSHAGWRVDYIEIRDAATLGASRPHAPRVVLGAAWLGTTRLIDNIEFPA